MFHLSLHSKKNLKNLDYSHSWYEELEKASLPKRVVHETYTEAFLRSKLAESIHNACMRSFGFCGEAEATALRVCQEVEDWLMDKEEVTKADIKRVAADALRHYNPRAAYEYLPSKDYAVTEDQYGFVRL